MENKQINDFFKDIILGKFLVNFVPGFILYCVISNLFRLRFGPGITELLVVISFSWVLGLILEIVGFRSTFFSRRQNQQEESLIYLLLGKTGIAILIACIFWIDLSWLLEFLEESNDFEMKHAKILFKFLLVATGGFLLFRMYKKNSNIVQAQN